MIKPLNLRLERYAIAIIAILAIFSAILLYTAEAMWRAVGDEQRGYAALQKGDVKRAITCLKRSIDSGHATPVAHLLLGQALQRSGDLNSAVAEFRVALAENRNQIPFVSAHMALGEALLRLGRTREAIGELTSALRAFPNYAADILKLADEMASEGKKSEAEAAYGVVSDVGLSPWSHVAIKKMRGLSR